MGEGSDKNWKKTDGGSNGGRQESCRLGLISSAAWDKRHGNSTYCDEDDTKLQWTFNKSVCTVADDGKAPRDKRDSHIGA